MAADRAEFDHHCMTPVERTPAQYQWCVMRQHQLDREEDRFERQEDRNAAEERRFQSWRRERLKPKPKMKCTSRSNWTGQTETECEED